MSSIPPGDYLVIQLTPKIVNSSEIDADYIVTQLDDDYVDFARPSRAYVHFYCHGNSDGNSTNQTIVIIPDIGETFSLLEKEMKKHDQEHRVCILDRIGFYSHYANSVDLILSLLERIPNRYPLTLIGRGKVGAILAMKFAQSYPKRVGSIHVLPSLGCKMEKKVVQQMIWLSYFGFAWLHPEYNGIRDFYDSVTGEQINHPLASPTMEMVKKITLNDAFFWKSIEFDFEIMKLEPSVSNSTNISLVIDSSVKIPSIWMEKFDVSQ